MLFLAKRNQNLLRRKNSKILIIFERISLSWIKWNEFSFTGDKFIPELRLKHPEFTYSACGLFTKHCERIQNFRETSNSKYLYRNALEKVCFAHDAAYSNIKYLAKGTISD